MAVADDSIWVTAARSVLRFPEDGGARWLLTQELTRPHAIAAEGDTVVVVGPWRAAAWTVGAVLGPSPPMASHAQAVRVATRTLVCHIERGLESKTARIRFTRVREATIDTPVGFSRVREATISTRVAFTCAREATIGIRVSFMRVREATIGTRVSFTRVRVRTRTSGTAHETTGRT